jgi:hypothetical protein
MKNILFLFRRRKEEEEEGKRLARDPLASFPLSRKMRHLVGKRKLSTKREGEPRHFAAPSKKKIKVFLRTVPTKGERKRFSEKIKTKR